MKSLFLLFCFIPFFGYGQLSKIDSLCSAKDYLMKISRVANAKQQNINKLNLLIKEASQHEQKFKTNLKAVISEENSEFKAMTNSFHLILQSLVLYRSDVSEKNNGSSERLYLNQNIPPLIDKINLRCKIFEDKTNFKTY